jgi:hypothetical protein
VHLVARRLFYIPFGFSRYARVLGLAGLTYTVSRWLATDQVAVNVLLNTCLMTGFVLGIPLLRFIPPDGLSELRRIARSLLGVRIQT